MILYLLHHLSSLAPEEQDPTTIAIVIDLLALVLSRRFYRTGQGGPRLTYSMDIIACLE